MDPNLFVAIAALAVSVLSGPMTLVITVKVLESRLGRAEADIAAGRTDHDEDMKALNTRLDGLSSQLGATREDIAGIKGMLEEDRRN